METMTEEAVLPVCSDDANLEKAAVMNNEIAMDTSEIVNTPEVTPTTEIVPISEQVNIGEAVKEQVDFVPEAMETEPVVEQSVAEFGIETDIHALAQQADENNKVIENVGDVVSEHVEEHLQEEMVHEDETIQEHVVTEDIVEGISEQAIHEEHVEEISQEHVEEISQDAVSLEEHVEETVQEHVEEQVEHVEEQVEEHVQEQVEQHIEEQVEHVPDQTEVEHVEEHIQEETIQEHVEEHVEETVQEHVEEHIQGNLHVEEQVQEMMKEQKLEEEIEEHAEDVQQIQDHLAEHHKCEDSIDSIESSDIMMGDVLNDSIPGNEVVVDANISSGEMVQELEEIIEGTQETVVVVTSSDTTGTKEIVLTTSGHQVPAGSVTVQQVTDENGQVYLLETMDDVIVMESEENSDGVEYVEMQQRPKNLPSHVLGRNIDNPSIDPFRNGKAPPKPRLGVKIPYRNLTSQIVSKQEIADEILERSKRNNKDTGTGQNLFAKKLTQTLAKKLQPPSAKKPVMKKQEEEKKLNNSDLIAILEGDDDEVDTPKEAIQMTKELEREIALKQLSELPDDPPPSEIKMERQPMREAVEKPPSPIKQSPSPVKQSSSSSSSIKQSTSPIKQSSSPVKQQAPVKQQQAPSSPAPVVEESPSIKKVRSRVKKDEGEDDDPLKCPRFSSNVPIKTYTRKRKPSEEVAAYLEKSPPVHQIKVVEVVKKIDLPTNSNNYITKSSRIIKKKIIWDPDEVSTPKKLAKSNEVNNKEKLTTITNKTDKKEAEKKEVKAEVSGSKLLSIKPEKKIDATKVERKAMEKTDSPKVEIKKVEIRKIPQIEIKKMQIRKPEVRLEKKIIDKPRETRSPRNVIKEQSPRNLKEQQELLKSPNEKIKKKKTEIDKLLGDEGAVNMLYSIKNTEEDQTRKRINKSLMGKTNELLNDLQTSSDKVSPKALRKKESTPTLTVTPKPLLQKKLSNSPIPSAISRQKSRDSNRSSVHSPPPSPGLICGADASRIIRRHSSSSFSSTDGDDSDEKVVKKTELRSGRRKLEGAAGEGPKKKVKREEIETKEVKTKEEKTKEDKTKDFNKLIEAEPENVVKYEKYKSCSVKKIGQLYQIVLDKSKEHLNIETMQELCAILKDLETDCECNVVVITSNGPSFSKGLNYKTLIAPKETTRKNLAKKLATNVRDFLLSLANFPKVLVAGVHGDVIGLGVTMLPLFDMVIANETASFTTPYSNLGCIAEGGSLLCLSHLSQNILVSELLFRSQKLSSGDALKLGLITRLLMPAKFEEELLSSLRIMSNQSQQFMESTKKQLRQRMIPDITASLNSETETLVQQWIGTECQKNFTTVYSN